MAVSASLAALFGAGPPAPAASGRASEAIAALRRALAPGAEAQGIARQEKDPLTLSALARFRQAVASAPSIEQALSDPRILTVVMPALGLPDQAAQPGLVRRALLSDPADPNSLAARLGSAWKAAAATLKAYRHGLAALTDPAMLQRLSEAYRQYRYRKGLDAQHPGLADALYFLDRARHISNPYTLLGDPVLRRVVSGALGLPDQLALQSVEAQARAVTTRLAIASLKQPALVRKLAERYLIASADKAAQQAAHPLPHDAVTLITPLTIRA